jgi:glycosyltransferase involved in cell wall biosynthesis
VKVLNLIWGFSLGGVGRCFLTYAGLGTVDARLDVHTACIDPTGGRCDLSPLAAIGATVISIRGRGDFSWVSRCRELLARVRPDVIFTHGFNGPVAIEVVRRRYGLATPMLCSYHSEYHPPRFNRRFVAPLLNATVHCIYRHRTRGIVTVVNCNKSFLLACGVPADRVTVVHNGIPWRPLPTIRTPGARGPGDVTVGIASRLDPIKGLEYLLPAVADVRAQGIGLRLVLVGDGPLEADLRRQAAALALGEGVQFAGCQTDIEARLESWDIFALPSLSEAHSISLLEAMRAGKAILATNVGGNPESVRDGLEALLVPAADVKALSRGLARLAGDRALRERLGLAARRRFEAEFTEAVMQRRLATWMLGFCGRAAGDALAPGRVEAA